MTKLTVVESEGTWRQLPVGQQVHERYTALAKQVLQFEKQWFHGWRDNVDNAAMRYLKQPIFTRSQDTGECCVAFMAALPRGAHPPFVMKVTCVLLSSPIHPTLVCASP
jgi:hypothetical protein